MSHAALLVSLDAGNTDIEAAVTEQMEPFDENNEWFKDGSRWDWWQIGGRYTGKLSGYDPDKDTANIEQCDLCAGTGCRPGWAVMVDGVKKFLSYDGKPRSKKWSEECGGCNGCHGTGSKTKWATERNPHAGDIMLVRNLAPNKLAAIQKNNAEETWAEAMKEKDARNRGFLYGIKKGESKSNYIKRHTSQGWFPRFHAFLRCRQWHESGRMGWFGVSAPTECELLGRDKGKCLFRHGDYARIVGWNEPDDTWHFKFYDRFIKPLAPDSILVVVDYHV